MVCTDQVPSNKILKRGNKPWNFLEWEYIGKRSEREKYPNNSDIYQNHDAPPRSTLARILWHAVVTICPLSCGLLMETPTKCITRASSAGSIYRDQTGCQSPKKREGIGMPIIYTGYKAKGWQETTQMESQSSTRPILGKIIIPYQFCRTHS